MVLDLKVHFTRPPKAGELKTVFRNGTTEIHMAQSAQKRLSGKAKKMINDAGAAVIIESSRGRPLELSPKQIAEIVEMHRDNRSFREIEKTTGVSKSTAHYLIKYAERQKLKVGKKIIYL